MSINTKITLAAALVLGAASAALANDIDVNPSSTQSAREWTQYLAHRQKDENRLAYNACPALEGYPDCHPDDSASRAQYSTEFMAQKKSLAPKARRQITPRTFGANSYRSVLAPSPAPEAEWPRMNCDMPIGC
jgi:hypothetical protein